MKPTDLEFRHRYPVDVRFRDVDIGGHAHHSQALIYFEEARAAYWREVTGRSGLDEIDYVLAEVRVRYHHRVLYPARLGVGVRVIRLGKKHFEMAYRADDESGRPLVSGESVQVMFDYEEGRSTSMSTEIRDRIEAVDGPFGPGGRPVDLEGF